MERSYYCKNLVLCGKKISNKRPSNMSQSPLKQVSGQRTQCVTYRAYRLLQCVNVPVRVDLSSACSCSSASSNLRSSTQSCVQLHISNPVITGFSAPGKTIIGTSCLFVLSFPLPVLTMTKLTFAKAGPQMELMFLMRGGTLGYILHPSATASH